MITLRHTTYSGREANQLSLFDHEAGQSLEALWEPRDIWVRFGEELISRFREDSRVEYKSVRRVDFRSLSEYYSMYSNSAEGGCLVLGVGDTGEVEGCSALSQDKLNRIENFHIQMCPLAKPELKRLPVQNGTDFLICIFLPYVGVLVENSQGDAFIRYGDTKHKMNDEEKHDFRSTRQQRRFEAEVSPLSYPDDF